MKGKRLKITTSQHKRLFYKSVYVFHKLQYVDVPYAIKINYLKIDVVFWKLQTLALYVHDKWTIFYYG